MAQLACCSGPACCIFPFSWHASSYTASPTSHSICSPPPSRCGLASACPCCPPSLGPLSSPHPLRRHASLTSGSARKALLGNRVPAASRCLSPSCPSRWTAGRAAAAAAVTLLAVATAIPAVRVIAQAARCSAIVSLGSLNQSPMQPPAVIADGPCSSKESRVSAGNAEIPVCDL